MKRLGWSFTTTRLGIGLRGRSSAWPRSEIKLFLRRCVGQIEDAARVR
jgi:hypothetical protein